MIMRRVAEKCYLPMNELLMRQIEKFGDKVKFAFSFSGVVIEQMEQFAPEVLESFQKLVATGKVEVLSETYAHSLASMSNPDAENSIARDLAQTGLACGEYQEVDSTKVEHGYLFGGQHTIVSQLIIVVSCQCVVGSRQKQTRAGEGLVGIVHAAIGGEEEQTLSLLVTTS